jgi:hypothetical protein
VKKVAPLYNRLVIFDSHDKSFHGLPDPVNFPEHEPRVDHSLLLHEGTAPGWPGRRGRAAQRALEEAESPGQAR